MSFLYYFSGQYGYDDANSTPSVHNSPQSEAVSCAIMEVSGELMLGKFSSQKQHSDDSESSDMSDEDGRRAMSRGSIARYPESSTGLSDNDWNPYATESDTNQTPRSPRSNNSDDQSRGGYVSMATFNIGGAGKKVDANVEQSKRVTEDKNEKENLDILRFVMESDRPKEVSTELGRLSEDSVAPILVSESRESKAFDTKTSESSTLSGRPLEFDRGAVFVRESVDSQRDGTCSLSGSQSVKSDMSAKSGCKFVETEWDKKSNGSEFSAQSKQSEKSAVRSVGSDRSDRLDQLSDAAGGNIKHLIEFESAQRYRAADSKSKEEEEEPPEDVERRQVESTRDVIARTRISAKVESYGTSVRSAKSPEPSPTVINNSGSYVSVSERERLLSKSPELANILPRFKSEEAVTSRPRAMNVSSQKIPGSMIDRSPSEASMKRVSSLFEETKKQAREAVALSYMSRPDPSGSEERFPLRERLTISKHDDSFKLQDNSGEMEGLQEKAIDPEAARSLNSEEVARVMRRYHNENVLQLQENNVIENLVPVTTIDKGGDVRCSKGRLSSHSDEESDQIAQRVQALLSQAASYTNRTNTVPKSSSDADCVQHSLDYFRLQQDLQEIQDSIHDAPAANDSMCLPKRGKSAAERSLDDEYLKSLEATRSTVGGRDSGISEYGRESGVSEYGRKLVWDHGADLQYDKGYDGQFIGKTVLKGGTSLSVREPEHTLTGRSSEETIDTDIDPAYLQRFRPVSQSDLSRAEKIVDQVMSRRAEGDLKESVEDIIARYRHERRDLFDRLQGPPEPSVVSTSKLEPVLTAETRKSMPVLKDPNIALSTLNPAGATSQPKNGKKHAGLAERVFKILRDEETEESDNPDEKGMAKKVYKILASDRPEDQVNGILAKAMAEENKALKQMVTKPKEDSSCDDSALNATAESYDLSEQDVKKQLEYSLYSSPGKGDKVEFEALREVASAPYSALSNAKSLLSSQLQKMSHRNFDKSVELRTPYRQTIDCYPIYGVERRAASERPIAQTQAREAWISSGRSESQQSIHGGRDLGK